MNKTIQLSAIVTATILVAGLVAVGFSDEAFAKPDTKKVLIQVRDAAGDAVPKPLCIQLEDFPPGPDNWLMGNNGGVLKFNVPSGQTILNIVCIDEIPLNAVSVETGIPLKAQGTTVVPITLNL